MGARVFFCPLKGLPGKCVLVLIRSELHHQTFYGVRGRTGLSLHYEQTGEAINGMNINNGNEGVKFSRSWAVMKRDALKCA